MCEPQLILRFCKSLIFKHSHRTQGLRQKNRVLNYEKMVSIYHKMMSGTRVFFAINASY